MWRSQFSRSVVCALSHARKAGDVSKGVLKGLEKHPGETVKAQKRARVSVADVVANGLVKRERANVWAVEELSKRHCCLYSQLRGVHIQPSAVCVGGGLHRE